MPSISQLFGQHLDINALGLPDGQVLDVKLDKPAGEIQVRLQFDALVPRALLKQTGAVLADSLEMKRCLLQPRYAPDLLAPGYLPELVAVLREEGLPANGFFEGASAELEQGCMRISLPRGGAEFLTQKDCAARMERSILEEFGVGISVLLLDGEGAADQMADERAEVMRRADEHMKEAARQAQAAREVQAGKAPAEKRRGKVSFDLGDLPIVPGSMVLIKGRSIKSTPVPLREVNGETGEVVVWGEIFSLVRRESRDGTKAIYSLNITDFTGSNTVKVISDISSPDKPDPVADVREGDCIVVHGEAAYDKYDHEVSIRAFDIASVERTRRTDEAAEKRVELHMHTNMSMMDAITPVGKLIQRVHSWGHPAVAITDHGVAQAYPDAMNAAAKIRKKDPDFKVIYGVENYLVNDTTRIVSGKADVPFDGEFIVFDVETTGFSASRDRITEIGAVKLVGGAVAGSFDTFVHVDRKLSAEIVELTGITDEMLATAPSEEEAIRRFYDFIGSDNATLVAHNAGFDMGFLMAAARRCNLKCNFTSVDTVPLSRSLFRDLKKHSLDSVAKHLGLANFKHHRAEDDAAVLAQIFLRMIDVLKQDRGAETTGAINGVCAQEDPKTLHAYHQILLVKNETGLKNLYKLVSMSHLNYYYRVPRVPKSVLAEHREGLIVGSACEAGELFRAITAGKNWTELSEIAGFYDYLEIQPIANNAFMLRKDPTLTEEDLREYNRTVVRLGERLGIPVVATGDVHFMEPEDAIFREILMAGKGFSDASQQAPLYLHTTDEMLAEFSYLGEQKAVRLLLKIPGKLQSRWSRSGPYPRAPIPHILTALTRTWSESRGIEPTPYTGVRCRSWSKNG